jgi:hypothetical protein
MAQQPGKPWIRFALILAFFTEITLTVSTWLGQRANRLRQRAHPSTEPSI